MLIFVVPPRLGCNVVLSNDEKLSHEAGIVELTYESVRFCNGTFPAFENAIAYVCVVLCWNERLMSATPTNDVTLMMNGIDWSILSERKRIVPE